MEPGKRIKVLYVFGGEKASGAEIVIERLIRYNTDNVEAHLFLSPGIFADKLLSSSPPYNIRTLPELRKLNRSSVSGSKYFIEAFKKYLRISKIVTAYLKKENIKFVHANTVVPAAYLLPAKLCTLHRRYKFVWSDHDIRYFSRLDERISRLCTRLFNHTITVSKAVKVKYRNAKKVSVLYNGLDVNKFQPDDGAREVFKFKFGLVDNKLLLGMAGIISPRKGQYELIKILEETEYFKGAVKLVLAGVYGEDDILYCKKVKDIVLNNPNILYIGQVDDMASFYNGCDVIINNSSSSGSEPLGTTIIEGMACGKVVFASNTGGTGEIITHGVTGFVFEANNSDSLKHELSQIVSNYAALYGVREKARREVLERFAIGKMAMSYNKLLDQL